MSIRNISRAIVLAAGLLTVSAFGYESVELKADMRFMNCRLNGPSSEICYLPAKSESTFVLRLMPERETRNLVGMMTLRSFSDGWEYTGKIKIVQLYGLNEYLVDMDVKAFRGGQVLMGTPVHAFVRNLEDINDIFAFGVPMGITGSNHRYLPAVSIGPMVYESPIDPIDSPEDDLVRRERAIIRSL